MSIPSSTSSLSEAIGERAIRIANQLTQMPPESLRPENIQEISNLLQQLGATTAQHPSIASTPPISYHQHPSVPEVKIRHPEFFSGERKQIGEFLSQVNMVIETQPTKFNADKTKVMYLCSHLRGPAYSWAQSYIETLRTANEHPCLSDFDLFVKMLLAAFGDPDPRATARRELFRIRQGSSSAADYAAAFQRAAVRTKWNPEALRDMFDEGLNDDLRRELSTRDLPDTFAEYIPKVIALDNQMREFRLQRSHSGKLPFYMDYRKVNRLPSQNFSHTRSLPERSSSASTTSSDFRQVSSTPMEIGAVHQKYSPLTSEERTRRIENKLCLYCGQPGHVAVSCPAKTQTPKKFNTQY